MTKRIAIIGPKDALDETSRFYYFQNRIILRNIYLILKTKTDCRVEYIDFRNPSIFFRKKFDLVLGFSHAFRFIRAQRKILIFFEEHPAQLNRMEKFAIDIQKSFSNITLKSERSRSYYWESDLTKCDACIVLGDDQKLKNFRQFSPNLKYYLVGPVADMEFVNCNKPNIKNKLIFSASRGDALKGIPMMIALAQKLREFEFHVLGKMKEELEKFSSLPPNIICYGFVDNLKYEMKEVFESAFLNINLSFSEGVSTSILDGMTFGLPFVSLGYTGVEGWAPGAFIKCRPDVTEISETIRKISLDEEIYNDMVVATQIAFSRYSVEKHKVQLGEHLNAIIENC